MITWCLCLLEICSAKIKAKEFVDMTEILRDNIKLERRQMNEVMPSTTHLSRREVPALLSWVVFFKMFASVVLSLDPGKTKQLWVCLATAVIEGGPQAWWERLADLRLHVLPVGRWSFCSGVVHPQCVTLCYHLYCSSHW